MYSTVLLLALSVICVNNARIVCHKGLCATVRDNEGSKLVMSDLQCHRDEECNNIVISPGHIISNTDTVYLKGSDEW